MELKQLLKHLSNSFTDSPKHARRRPSKPIDNTLATIDYLEERVLLAADYGDAPDSSSATGKNDYQTTAPNNGPRHTIDATKTTLFLGASVDGDLGLSQSRAAVLDDLFSAGGKDDEDGVLNALDLTSTVGANAKVTLSATNKTTKAATLYGWIDFNQNGIFENATERASIAVPKGTTAGRFTLTFPTTPPANLGLTYSRFRLSTDTAAANPIGLARDGEVEDYPFVIRPRVNLSTPAATITTIADGLSPSSSSSYGMAPTPVGDLDGNGIIDIAVGAPGEGDTKGSVYVLLRNSDGTVKSSTKIASRENGGPTLAELDYFGASIAPLGDIDGDGITDLAIGGLGSGEKGIVYISRLKADGTLKSFTKLASGSNGMPTLSDDSRAGVITSIGDIDSDGVSDLAVGAPGTDAGGDSRGGIYIVRLKPDGTVKNFNLIENSTSWNSTAADKDQFGLMIAFLGDINGDGAPELVVTSDPDDGSGNSLVHLISLNQDGTLKSAKQLVSSARPDATIPEDIFSLISIGDINGDGIRELAMSGINTQLDETGLQFVGKLALLTINSEGSIGRSIAVPQDQFTGWEMLMSSLSVLGNTGSNGELQLLMGLPMQGDPMSPSPEVVLVTLANAVVNLTAPGVPQILTPTGTVNQFRPSITWSALANATDYLVWLKNESTGQVIVNSVSTPDPSFQPTMDLGIGKYSVSIRAKNEVGLSAWSPTVRFTVTALPVITPTPDGMNRRPMIEWDSIPGADRYEVSLLEMATSSSTRAIVGSTDFVPTRDLSDGNYFVWVRAIAKDGTLGPWSAGELFNVWSKLDVVNVTRQELNRPLIVVTLHEGIASYQATITDLANPDSPAVRQNLIEVGSTYQGTQLTTAGPIATGRYRIQVRPIDSDGNAGQWSDAFDIKTGPTLNPVSATVRAGSDVNVSWQLIPDASYDVWIEAPGGRKTLSNIRTNSVFLTPEQGIVRVWVKAHVAAFADAGNSRWSEMLEFRVLGKIEGVSLKNTIASTGTITVEWPKQRNIVSYEVRIDDTVNQITGKITAANIRGTSYVIPEALEIGTFAVFVRGTSADGTVGEWSQALVPTTSSIPQLKDPVTLSWSERRLEWQPVGGAFGYDVVVKRTAPTKGREQFFVTPSASINVPNLDDGQYQWMVRARGIPPMPLYTMLWSPPATFEVTSKPIVTAPSSFNSTDGRKLIEWNHVSGTDVYDIWVMNDRYVTVLKDQKPGSPGYDLGSQLGAGRYRVWVRSVFPSGYGKWCNPVEFSIV